MRTGLDKKIDGVRWSEAVGMTTHMPPRPSIHLATTVTIRQRSVVSMDSSSSVQSSPVSAKRQHGVHLTPWTSQAIQSSSDHPLSPTTICHAYSPTDKYTLLHPPSHPPTHHTHFFQRHFFTEFAPVINLKC